MQKKKRKRGTNEKIGRRPIIGPLQHRNMRKSKKEQR
jgi:hypothetical protein